MVNTANELIENTKEMMDLVLSRTITMDSLESISDEDVAIMRKTKVLIDLGYKYILEEAKTIERMERKLDKLLEQKKD